MMFGKPAFSVYPDHGADAFDTLQRPGQPAATTDGLSTTLADWEGKRSRRVPGEGEPNEVRRTSEDDRRESSGKSTAGATGRSDKERSEPRTHESARASGASSGVASETQFLFHQ